jgi:cell division protein ZapA
MAESVNITICGRNYPVRIEGHEKETLTKAVAFVNERIKLYEKNYPATDKQDQLSMTLIQLALQFHKSENQELQKSEGFKKQMEETEQYLSQYLESIEFK